MTVKRIAEAVIGQCAECRSPVYGAPGSDTPVRVSCPPTCAAYRKLEN